MPGWSTRLDCNERIFQDHCICLAYGWGRASALDSLCKSTGFLKRAFTYGLWQQRSKFLIKASNNVFISHCLSWSLIEIWVVFSVILMIVSGITPDTGVPFIILVEMLSKTARVTLLKYSALAHSIGLSVNRLMVAVLLARKNSLWLGLLLKFTRNNMLIRR